MANKTSDADPRRQLKRAACLLQGFRDALTPEIAAKLEPIGKLLEPAVEAVEWGCPRPPEGELTPEQRASLQYAKETSRRFWPSAEPTPKTTGPPMRC